ncbi:hypothetical protein ACFLZ9_01320, partial [Patescibacteria group bacterium]
MTNQTMAANYQEPKHTTKMYKWLNIFVVSTLVFNMSLVGVFFVATPDAQATPEICGECGDGTINPGEDCDDGNNEDGDGCSANCTIEQTCGICGDGNLDAGEDCDDGNNEDGDGCSANCTIEQINPICGNEVVEEGEECEFDQDCDGDGYTCNGCQCIPPTPDTVTILAYKVVCESEEDLPNRHGGGDIGPATASDYVARQDVNCAWAQEEWDFEWGEHELDGTLFPGNSTAKASDSESDWQLFDPASNGSSPAQAVIELTDGLGDNQGLIWFREVLKPGYKGYSIPPGSAPGSDISAELWCNTDVLNYDNMEDMNVAQLTPGETYYCVAFNVLEEEPTGSIRVCKWNDTDRDGEFDPLTAPDFTAAIFTQATLCEPIVGRANPLSGWTMVATGDKGTFSGVTDESGCVELEVPYGTYTITEELTPGWEQVLPSSGSFTDVVVGEDQECQDISFLNRTQEQEGPECGNEILEDGEQCDDGPSGSDLCTPECTTRGGPGPRPYCGDGTCSSEENCSTCSEDCGGCGGGPNCLILGTCGGGPTPGPTPTPIPESGGPDVLGEEGAPKLVVTKTVSQEMANPGDTNIEFIVNVTNEGNITAFEVTLNDVMPEGLKFSSGEETKDWNLGNIAPGETQTVAYMVDVAESAQPMIYANIATA